METAEGKPNTAMPRWPYILLVVPPLLFILGYFLHRSEAQVLDRMQAAPATVEKSEVYSSGHGESTTYHLDLEYEYSVADRRYIGRKIGMANIMYDSKENAMEILKQYPVGKEIQIYFDPEEPELAVITREEPGNGLMTITLAGLLLVILWPVAFIVLRYARKRSSS